KMRPEFLMSRGDSNLSAGELAPPGIYVVVHHDPPHLTPHEILIETPTILPRCKSCFDVRYSFKAPLPPPLEHGDVLRAERDLRSMTEITNRLVAASRKLLDRDER